MMVRKGIEAKVVHLTSDHGEWLSIGLFIGGLEDATALDGGVVVICQEMSFSVNYVSISDA
jgi:hypothetical protein